MSQGLMCHIFFVFSDVLFFAFIIGLLKVLFYPLMHKSTLNCLVQATNKLTLPQQQISTFATDSQQKLDLTHSKILILSCSGCMLGVVVLLQGKCSFLSLVSYSVSSSIALYFYPTISPSVHPCLRKASPHHNAATMLI